MTTSAISNPVKLAHNWTKSRVLGCLDSQQRLEITRFLSERYSERFFGPINLLRDDSQSHIGFGFAIMALCSLLIETLQCYRRGLPSSNEGELSKLEKSSTNTSAPADYRLAKPFNAGSEKIFDEFFAELENQKFFPGLNGITFYQEIRCGLLHQAQTKAGWRIVKDGPFWDIGSSTIGRNEFSDRLRACFDSYLGELSKDTNWNGNLWKPARKKVWWLAQIS